MLIGVNLSHDYSHCVIDGARLALYEEERRSRIRYHWNESSYTLACLDCYSTAELASVEAIYLCCPRPQLVQQRSGDLSSTNREYRFVGGIPGPNQEGGVATGHLEVEGLRIPAAMVSHYHAHALGAFWSSQFEEADVMCLDGGGDFGEGAFLHASHDRLVLDKRYLDTQLGSSYHHFSLKVFKQDAGFYESKVMAMAALGRADRSEATYLSSRGRLNPISEDVRISVHDVADFQARFEDGVIELLSNATQTSDNLVCVGGVFYNVLLNLRIAEEQIYQRVFVPPHAGDMGTALGCALMAAREVGAELPDRSVFQSPYLGDELEVDVEALRAIIEARGGVAVFHDLPSAYDRLDGTVGG